MARIAGVNIPTNKRVLIALQYIHGIGQKNAAEIIKKRLDKVRIKETGERLTQPGKIALVYSNQKDLAEYQEYVEFLKNKNILRPGVELLELEELQGVKGLKAIRVEINMEM